MKQIFIIIAAGIVLLGIGLGVYFLFFAPKGTALTVGNPFSGTQSGSVTPSSDLPTDGMLNNAGTMLAPRFIKITDGPVAQGTVAFALQATSTASTTASTTPTSDVEVRFIDRASGNVYSYVAHARTLTRISNKTLPGIQRASWTPDGSRVFAQFLSGTNSSEQINTYSMNPKGGEGYLLENGLSQAFVIGSSTLFTLFPGSTGSVGAVSRIDGSNPRTLFSSVLSAITVRGSSGDLFAVNKPSSQIDGYAFQINRTTGSFSRILGPYRGLTVLPSPSGKGLMYSFMSAGLYQLRFVDVATRTTVSLPLGTITDKCVWAANGLSAYCAVPVNMQGNLPDDWYQGAVTFTDRIWKIDLTQRVATLVLDPSQIGKVDVDAVSLTVDPAEDMLTFTDKHTGALYVYDL